MEKRVLIAILLCFLSLYLWQALVVKPVPKPAAQNAQTQTTPTAPVDQSPTQSQPAPVEAAPPAAATLIGEASERDVVVETQDVIAVFTNRGARLKSWRLKHYLDRNQQPQELVVGQLGVESLPFTIRVADEKVTAAINSALFAVSGTPTEGASATAPTRLRFEYSTADNQLHVVKEFEVAPTGYIITFSASAAPPYAISWGPAVGDLAEKSQYVQQARGLLSEKNKIQRLPRKDLESQPVREGDFQFVGVDDNYFMSAVLSPGVSKVIFQPISIPPPATSKDPPRELIAYSLESKRADSRLRFFAGPKDFDVLAAVDRDLVRAIDFGIFAVLVVPLLRSLKWVNSYVGNYGWSIIILTVILNAIMFPLRHKSVVSMRKMQELQPEVKAIQDRYAKLKTTDPARQKMNQELMGLYRDRGVNPASGCVPMLLTMPVLIAFYALLTTAIELRGAPFFGWIRDLSVHDPLYVTPVLMGATMVWQQKISPATGVDPMQQKMMMLMPIVFTFMFLWAPAGVAVYWFMSNLWTIGQQYLTNYLIGPPNVRSVRPPAERRMKRVGGGKTEAATREP
jgi:YidC/Oxa1 family membrane protein insertase